MDDEELIERIYRGLPGHECPEYSVRIDGMEYTLLCQQPCTGEPCRLEDGLKEQRDLYLRRRDKQR